MHETTSEEFTPEQAFVGSLATPEIFGEALRPFSFSRKLAAQSMGCRAPAISGAALESLRTTGLYPGAQNDAIIVTWLRTIKDNSEMTPADYRAGEFTPERALHQPEQAGKKPAHGRRRTDWITSAARSSSRCGSSSWKWFSASTPARSRWKWKARADRKRKIPPTQKGSPASRPRPHPLAGRAANRAHRNPRLGETQRC